MIKDKIWIGKEIETLAGYEIITGYTGHIVGTKSYEIDENGNGVYVNNRLLTLNEIGHMMKDVDGHNHKIEYVSFSDLSYSQVKDALKNL